MLSPASRVNIGSIVGQVDFAEYDFGTLLSVSGIKAVIITLQLYVSGAAAAATASQRGIRVFARPADDGTSARDNTTLIASYEVTHITGVDDEWTSTIEVTIKCATAGGDANKADIGTTVGVVAGGSAEVSTGYIVGYYT